MDTFCGSKFWDLNVTWNTGNPRFTPCFEKTLLVWIPSGFLSLAATFAFYSAMKGRSGKIPVSLLGILQQALTTILLLLQIIQLSFTFQKIDDSSDKKLYPADQAAPAIKIATFVLALALQIYTKRKGIQSSAVLFVFWLLLTLCSGFEFASSIRDVVSDKDRNEKNLYTIITLVGYPIVIIEFILNFFADRPPVRGDFGKNKIINSSKPQADSKKTRPCPQYLSSIPNQWTYQWMYDLLWRAYKKPLEVVDLWELNDENKSGTLFERFNKYWKEDYENARSNKSNSVEKPASIFPSLWKCHWKTIVVSGILKLTTDALAFVGPLVMNLLIASEVREDGEGRWKGYLYMVIMFVSAVAQTLCNSNQAQLVQLVGMRWRAIASEAVYQKSLVVSNAARKDASVGQIVNLMSVDAQTFEEGMANIHTLWCAPLTFVAGSYFLWNVLGFAGLAGVFVFILVVPANILVANKSKTLRILQMTKKDDRVRLTNEMLTGIKVLKLYAWEPAFEKRVESLRETEIHILRWAAVWQATNMFIVSIAPILVSLVCFAVFVLMDEGNILTPQKAFVSLSLVVMIRLPLVMLPVAIAGLVQMQVSFGRINKFMNADEIRADSVTHEVDETGAVVKISQGTFSWDAETDGHTLKDINLSIKRGSVVAIVGPVGSGKSSLLSAVLGEIDKIAGSVNRVGSIAYVAQQAWIKNATVRDNILFGKKFESRFYNKVIRACALKPDLAILPGGDLTEIGEKGINLSGGQKQRVSLARAIYNGADIYLFDDPLSAVDSHVSKHLFRKVIGPKGILRDKTRIIVTHGITHLPQVDSIFVMNGGEIRESGSYKQLVVRKGDFANFLTQHCNHDNTNEAGKLLEDDTNQFQNPDPLETFVDLTRTNSISSMSSSISTSSSTEESGGISQGKAAASRLIEAETAEVGNVKNSVYMHFMKSMGAVMTVTAILSSVTSYGLNMYSSFWLAEWSSLPRNNGTHDLSERNLHLGVYGGLTVLQGITSFMGNILLVLGCVHAAKGLHELMLFRVLRSPMSFFDTTPIGRIINRFSKDLNVPDNIFPMCLIVWVNSSCRTLSSLVTISITAPFFLVVILPIGIVFIVAQMFYISTTRQLRRIDAVSRSPLVSQFSETLAGTSTIRAYNVQNECVKAFENCQDKNLTIYYPYLCTNRWLVVVLETIGSFTILFAALFAILTNQSEGLVGLSLSSALTTAFSLNTLVQYTLQIQTNIVSVERIKEYSELKQQEAAWEKPAVKPSGGWPEHGKIAFKNFQIRYRDCLDLVLKRIDGTINPGEKIGIVGRTGAGKSSLTLGLFRIMEAAGGSIEIDGKDISKLGLHDVRSKLTIIPQEPVLFVGSLRTNLDPHGNYSDEKLWQALELAHLKEFISSSSGGLDLAVLENGENFSVGQRQLICLARALLRKTKILILDEATAAVDLETDDLIQATIRSEFKDCTILTIAHRLNTILDYDRVMVLDQGEVVEFDTPGTLLDNCDSIFYSMAREAKLV